MKYYFVVQMYFKGKTIYQVRALLDNKLIRSYQTREEAEKALKELEKKGGKDK